MYLFSRRVRVRAGGTNDAMAWATGITEKARQVSDLDISLHIGVYGPEVGTLVWTAVVPDLMALEAATDKLNVDPSFGEQADRGQQFAPDGPNDRLLQFIVPDAETLAAAAAGDQSQPTYATVVSSVCAAGKLGRGIELGIEIAQRVTATIGTPTAFLIDTTGPYGGVNWISLHADAQAVEAANAAMAADVELATFIDEGVAGVYIDAPGATTQLLYRRIL